MEQQQRRAGAPLPAAKLEAGDLDGRYSAALHIRQERPSRASRTSVTASGKTIRIASRTWTACSSLRAGQLEAVDRGDGHVDRELDRVVGPGDPLRGLHLLGQLLHPGAELVRVTEEVEG